MIPNIIIGAPVSQSRLPYASHKYNASSDDNS